MSDHTLDTKRSGCQFLIEGLHVGDRGIRIFNFHFCEGQRSFRIPKDCIATLYASLPDSNKTTVYSPCKIEDNAVVYTLSGAPEGYASITSYPGRADCEIRLTALDGAVLTSPKFSFIVEDVLQDDSAIEANDDFSALTNALSRVLEAENGLESKVNKIAGVEGNVSVFGPDGSIVDSGISSDDITQSYIFVYDESKDHNGYNRTLLPHILSDIERGKSINIFINDLNKIFPATYEKNQSSLTVCACDASGSYTIQIYSSGNVKYEFSDNYNISSTYDEASITPASQKLTAEWVKQLIDDTIVKGAW